MNRFTHTLAATALSAALLALAGAAHASDPDLATLQKVPVTMAQAIATAEQKAQGRAISVDLEQGWTGATYEVKVVTAVKRMEVIVDATGGAVVSVKEMTEKDED